MSSLREYTEEMYNCIRCGFCQIHCPVFKAVGKEPAVARGKIELSKAVIAGKLEMTPKYSEYIMKCLLCGACKQNCPAGVKVDDIVRAARETYCTEKEPPPAMAELRKRIGATRNISGDPNDNRTLWVDDGQWTAQAVGGKAEVVYFVGCVSSLYPAVYRIPRSLVQVMRNAGVRFALMGGDEWCCGYPLIIGGMSSDAAELMRHNVEKIRETGASTLVATCPSCYHTWKHDYEKTLGESLGFEVLHSTEFLKNLIDEGRIKFDGRFEAALTYHDPCDLGRRNGIFDPPRDILKSIPGVTFVEMKATRENARCCGGGGNLEMNDPEVSGEVAKARVSEAVETGAGVLVTACQQCFRTLQGAARAGKARMKLMEVTEVVLKAMEA